MKWRIAVIDPDVRYRDRFLTQWKNQPQEGVEIEWMVTSAAFLEAHHLCPYDRVILDDSALDIHAKDEIKKAITPTHLFYWQDKTDARGLAKYQPVSRLRQELFYLLSHQQNGEHSAETSGQLIFCTALQGGIGVSTVTKALAAGYRHLFPQQAVFYFGVQPFWSLKDLYLDSEKNTALPYTLADVILAMRTPCADAEMRLAACVTEQDGVETFIPPSRPADFFDISQEEWIRLFRLVKKRASLVFVDCPAGWLWHFSTFFSVADRLFLFSDSCEEEGIRAFLDAIPYTWKEGRDAFIERKEAAEGTRSFCIPFLSGETNTLDQQWEIIAALRVSSSIKEVVEWIRA